MDTIELKKEELADLVKRAEIIGSKKFEVSMLERESAYKILEIVSSYAGDMSAVWIWDGAYLKIKKE